MFGWVAAYTVQSGVEPVSTPLIVGGVGMFGMVDFPPQLTIETAKMSAPTPKVIRRHTGPLSRMSAHVVASGVGEGVFGDEHAPPGERDWAVCDRIGVQRGHT